MMGRRHAEPPLRKHTLNLYSGDVDRLKELYGSASTIIRLLIRRHLKKVEAKTELERIHVTPEEITL
jgi:hypothetical protein